MNNLYQENIKLDSELLTAIYLKTEMFYCLRHSTTMIDLNNRWKWFQDQSNEYRYNVSLEANKLLEDGKLNE